MNGARLVILAGGISSRMRASARRDAGGLPVAPVPAAKTLIAVGRDKRPLLDYLLFNAECAGYQDVVLVVGEDSAAFGDYYGSAERDNVFHGLRISYAVQRIPAGRAKPLGTADALLQALRVRPDWSGEAFTVCNSDNLYSENAMRMILEVGSRCAAMGYDRDALRFDAARIRQFGIFHADPSGRLLDIIEKPSADQVARAADPNGQVRVSMNLWRFVYEMILPHLEAVPPDPVRHEKELPTAALMMLRDHPGSLAILPIAEHVPDLTSIHDINVLDEFLAKHYHGRLWP